MLLIEALQQLRDDIKIWVSNNIVYLKNYLLNYGTSSLKWDGDGLKCFSFGAFYRISDNAPSIQEAQQGGSVIISSPSSEYEGVFEFSSDDIVPEENQNIYSIVPASGNALSVILICVADTFINDQDKSSYIKKGVYVTGNQQTGYASSITFNDFSFQSKKIKSELIPDDLATYDAVYCINGDNIYVGDDVVTSQVPINADTVGGYTAEELIGGGIIDTKLSGTSTNPVQNKVLFEEIEQLKANLVDVSDSIGQIRDALNDILGV